MSNHHVVFALKVGDITVERKCRRRWVPFDSVTSVFSDKNNIDEVTVMLLNEIENELLKDLATSMKPLVHLLARKLADRAAEETKLITEGPNRGGHKDAPTTEPPGTKPPGQRRPTGFGQSERA